MVDFDLIIIGAGPAGMAAAVTATSHGASVLVLDEQPRPGGQIYRNMSPDAARTSWLGEAYAAGLPLVEAFQTCSARAVHEATVWSILPSGEVAWSKDGTSRRATARSVLICTGAQERPMPFPGWTLPGVMGAGAAQTLMKSSGLLPENAVLAGTGPLLYQIAVQMIRAGRPPLALVETQPRIPSPDALRHLPAAMLKAPRLLAKGLSFLGEIKKAGVARYQAARNFEARPQPDGTISFSFEANSTKQSIDCGLLLTHSGVIPSTSLTRSVGIPHHWGTAQKALAPVRDEWGRTNISSVWVAGDGAGIGGAEAAEAAGRIAAFDILRHLKIMTRGQRDTRAKQARSKLHSTMAIRPFLDAAYAPAREFRAPKNAVTACRCEEVSAGDVRQAITEGAVGLRKIKTATRAGMGPCQGRMCDPTIREILSEIEGSAAVADAAPRSRTPIKPVTLGELARLTPYTEDSA